MAMTSPSTSGPTRPSVLSGYSGLGRGYDEMLAPDGSLRPHCRAFAQGLDEIGLDEFKRRWHDAQQIIRENGVTSNIFGDPRGMERPWQLDPIPLIISRRESEDLEAGLVQRAQLLEAVLADLYGSQRLLAEGLVPAELVYGNSAFLRACRGIRVPGQRYLHLIAFDICRAPDGNLLVFADRTQTPSGAGYALENRIVVSRMMPEILRDCSVRRLALFFTTLRQTFGSLAPHDRDAPRTVVLTPGPFNETYFEHAYLARYLGCPLVQGGDLTVRDDRVFIKLVDGLQPVDVIWRRLLDDYCDPLELRGDSQLGVAGLVQVVRAGNVLVANALGSGLTESPAFMPYLPLLCRHLLGEELKMPSVPTFWCGEAKGMDHILAHLPRMVIKAAFPAMGDEPIFPSQLSHARRQHLSERLRNEPWRYVGQECLEMSTAPGLTEAGIGPCRVSLRAFLAAQDSSFTLMPGGLTRVTSADAMMIVGMPRNAGSKDTWMLNEAPNSVFSLLGAAGPTRELTRGGDELPSRVADNLFWLGRYVQRAEDLVRVLRGIVVRLTQAAGLAVPSELPILLKAVTHLTETFPGFVGDGAEERLRRPESELFSLVFQHDRVGTLAYNNARIRRVVISVRDRISMDMWRILSRLTPSEPSSSSTLSDLLELLDQQVFALAGFGGIAMESMVRGNGWRFLEMGRKIECSLHLVGLLQRTLLSTAPSENMLLEALLEIADCAMTYRRRYLSQMQAAPVLDLLLADESTPRSLVFQMQALRDVIDGLPRDSAYAVRSPEQRLIVSLLAATQLVDVSHLAQENEQGQRLELERFLMQLQQDLPSLADTINHHYMSHLQTARRLP